MFVNRLFCELIVGDQKKILSRNSPVFLQFVLVSMLLKLFFFVTDAPGKYARVCVSVNPLQPCLFLVKSGNTKGGSFTVPLTSCLTGLDLSVLQIKTKIVSSHTADSKPVKQEVNGTVILPPLAFPG